MSDKNNGDAEKRNGNDATGDDFVITALAAKTRADYDDAEKNAIGSMPIKKQLTMSRSIKMIKKETKVLMTRKKRYLIVAVVSMVAAGAAALISWKITNDAGEQALVQLAKSYMKDNVSNFRQQMDHQVQQIKHFHMHYHEFREMAQLDVSGATSGDSFFMMQKFLASWLYHYARGEACCVGAHSFRYSTYNEDQTYLNYGNAFANGGGVLLQPRDDDPGKVSIRLIGYSERQGDLLNNITGKSIKEEDRKNTSIFTPGWENPRMFPDTFFHVGNNHADTWIPCSALKEGEFTFLPVKGASNLDGVKPGIDLKACSGLYVSDPSDASGVTRKAIGILNGGFYLEWMARWLSELTIVTEKNAFVMAIELPSGYLVSSSNPLLEVTTLDSAGKITPVKTTEHSDELFVKPIAEAILSRACFGDWSLCPATGNINIEAKIDGGNQYFIEAGIYENAGIRWMVCVALSKSEMIDDVLKTRRGVVILALGLAAVVKVCATIVTKGYLHFSNKMWPLDDSPSNGEKGGIFEGVGESILEFAV